VPGLLFLSLRLLAEALLVPVRNLLRAFGLAGHEAERYEEAAAEPAATGEPVRAPRRRAAERHEEAAAEPAATGEPMRATRRRAAPPPPEPAADPPPAGGASVGAQVHVAEPWPGYDEMRLDDVLARLAAATEVELAIVRAYEREHQARQAVLLAAGEPA
jgi:hypothetical protein